MFKNDPQAFGSSITYMRRYCLSAIVGVSTDDDDDGEKAMRRNEPENTYKAKPKVEPKEPKPAENPDDPPITHEQLRKLHSTADKCDPDYISKVYGWLKDKGVNGFDGIRTSKLYESVIGGMQKNAQIYKGVKNV